MRRDRTVGAWHRVRLVYLLTTTVAVGLIRSLVGPYDLQHIGLLRRLRLLPLLLCRCKRLCCRGRPLLLRLPLLRERARDHTTVKNPDLFLTHTGLG